MKYLFLFGKEISSDVIKYVHNKQVISPIQLSEVDSVILCDVATTLYGLLLLDLYWIIIVLITWIL